METMQRPLQVLQPKKVYPPNNNGFKDKERFESLQKCREATPNKKLLKVLEAVFFLLAIKLASEVFTRNVYHSHQSFLQLPILKEREDLNNLQDYFFFNSTSLDVNFLKKNLQILNINLKIDLNSDKYYLLPKSSEFVWNDLGYILINAIPANFYSSHLDFDSLLQRIKELIKIVVLDRHLAKNEERKTKFMTEWQKNKVKQEIIPIFLSILKLVEKIINNQTDLPNSNNFDKINKSRLLKRVKIYQKILKNYQKDA